MTVHLISVGLSVLEKGLGDPRRKVHESVRPVARQRACSLLTGHGIQDPDRDAADEWIAAALAADARQPQAEELRKVAAAVRPDLWPSWISAEIETFDRVADGPGRPLPEEDIAIFICSDTPRGLLAGVWNAVALTAAADPGRVQYLRAPGDMPTGVRGNAVVVRVPDLDAGNEAGFTRAMRGLGTLGRNLLDGGEIGAGEQWRFCLSGGYKASIPYLIGLAEGLASLAEAGPVDAYVVHDTSQKDRPIRLPLRRIAPERVRCELARLTETPAAVVLPSDYLDGYAYEQVDGGVRLTAFGAGLKALFGSAPPVISG
jgi:hypothetical protein